MITIRDVFQCKPGQHRAVAAIFKQTSESFDIGGTTRVLIDVAAGFWTVVVEYEVEDLGAWEKAKAELIAQPELQAQIAGYHDLVVSGRREIFREV